MWIWYCDDTTVNINVTNASIMVVFSIMEVLGTSEWIWVQRWIFLGTTTIGVGHTIRIDVDKSRLFVAALEWMGFHRWMGCWDHYPSIWFEMGHETENETDLKQ